VVLHEEQLGKLTTVAGSPETIVMGHGAHGIAGRIGSWDDGLIVMRPGDVLRVRPEGGNKTTPFAVWIGEDGVPVSATWQDYENLQAVAKAEALVAEAEQAPDALNVAFAAMPAYSWHGGETAKGLKVEPGATGPVVAFGESGRGRSRLEVPLIGSSRRVRPSSAARSSSSKRKKSRRACSVTSPRSKRSGFHRDGDI